MLKLSFLSSFILLLGCSSISFLSSNKINTTFDFDDKNTTDVSIDIQKPFYMWGLYPKEHLVKVDEEFQKKGYSSVSDLIIKETETNIKALWMFFTFGMYYPQSFKLTAKVN